MAVQWLGLQAFTARGWVQSLVNECRRCRKPWKPQGTAIKKKKCGGTFSVFYAEVEAPILWPPDVKSQLTGKDSDAGKD